MTRVRYESEHEKRLRERINKLSLEEKVKRMFEIFDNKEVSDRSGKSFNTTTINSIRIFHCIELNELFKQMKEDCESISCE